MNAEKVILGVELKTEKEARMRNPVETITEVEQAGEQAEEQADALEVPCRGI